MSSSPRRALASALRVSAAAGHEGEWRRSQSTTYAAYLIATDVGEHNSAANFDGSSDYNAAPHDDASATFNIIVPPVKSSYNTFYVFLFFEFKSTSGDDKHIEFVIFIINSYRNPDHHHNLHTPAKHDVGRYKHLSILSDGIGTLFRRPPPKWTQQLHTPPLGPTDGESPCRVRLFLSRCPSTPPSSSRIPLSVAKRPSLPDPGLGDEICPGMLGECTDKISTEISALLLALQPKYRFGTRRNRAQVAGCGPKWTRQNPISR